MKPRNEMEDRITAMTASAMFGEKGAEEKRIGGGGTPYGKQENMLPRTMGAGWLLYAFTRVSEPDIVLEADKFSLDVVGYFYLGFCNIIRCSRSTLSFTLRSYIIINPF